MLSSLGIPSVSMEYLYNYWCMLSLMPAQQGHTHSAESMPL